MKRSARYFVIGIVSFGLLLLSILFRFELESPQVSKPIVLQEKDKVAKTTLPEMDIVENEVQNEIPKAPPSGAHPFRERVRQLTDPLNIAKSKEEWRRKENRRIFEEARAEVEAETGIDMSSPPHRPSWDEQMNWTREEYIAYVKNEDSENYLNAFLIAAYRSHERLLQSPDLSQEERVMIEKELEGRDEHMALNEKVRQTSREISANQAIRVREMSDEEWEEWNRDRIAREKAFSEAADRGETHQFIEKEMEALREEMQLQE